MEPINPYAPPDVEGAEPPKKKKKKKRARYTARFEGAMLVVSRDAELPSVCLKCGGHDEITFRKQAFQWTPVWARLLIPFCVLGGLIAMSLTRKHATLQLPLCMPCNARWIAARNATIAALVPLIGSFLYLRLGDDRGPALGLLLASVAVFAALMFFFVRPRMIQSDRIDDVEVHLKGFHTGAGQEIVDGSQ